MIQKSQPKAYTINLDGPDGNVFSLIGHAKGLVKQLNKQLSLELDFDEIMAEMTSSDYENGLITFNKYFGNYVVLETTDKWILDLFSTEEVITASKSGRADFEGFTWFTILSNGQPIIKEGQKLQFKALDENHAIECYQQLNSISINKSQNLQIMEKQQASRLPQDHPTGDQAIEASATQEVVAENTNATPATETASDLPDFGKLKTVDRDTIISQKMNEFDTDKTSDIKTQVLKTFSNVTYDHIYDGIKRVKAAANKPAVVETPAPEPQVAPVAETPASETSQTEEAK